METLVYMALAQEPSTMPSHDLAPLLGNPTNLTVGLLVWVMLRDLLPVVRSIGLSLAKRIETIAPVIVSDGSNGKVVDHELSMRIGALQDSHNQLATRVGVIAENLSAMNIDLRRHIAECEKEQPAAPAG